MTGSWELILLNSILFISFHSNLGEFKGKYEYLSKIFINVAYTPPPYLLSLGLLCLRNKQGKYYMDGILVDSFARDQFFLIHFLFHLEIPSLCRGEHKGIIQVSKVKARDHEGWGVHYLYNHYLIPISILNFTGNRVYQRKRFYYPLLSFMSRKKRWSENLNSGLLINEGTSTRLM